MSKFFDFNFVQDNLMGRNVFQKGVVSVVFVANQVEVKDNRLVAASGLVGAVAVKGSFLDHAQKAFLQHDFLAVHEKNVLAVQYVDQFKFVVPMDGQIVKGACGVGTIVLNRKKGRAALDHFFFLYVNRHKTSFKSARLFARRWPLVNIFLFFDTISRDL